MSGLEYFTVGSKVELLSDHGISVTHAYTDHPNHRITICEDHATTERAVGLLLDHGITVHLVRSIQFYDNQMDPWGATHYEIVTSEAH